jgi:hypothetical protein
LAIGWAAGPRPARAEFFEFSTTVSIDTATAVPAGSTVAGNNTDTAILTLNNGGSPADTVTMMGQTSAGNPFHEDGSPPGTDIVPLEIAVATNPATPLTNVAFNFTATMTLTNFTTATGGVATGTNTIQLTGRVSGSVGSGVRVNLSTLTGYATIPASGMVPVGGEPYFVEATAYTPPGSTRAGTFGARVQVPEPASLVLTSLGLAALWGLNCRRMMLRRRDATEG